MRFRRPFRMPMRNQARGFTLIEVLVVVVIVGIISAVAILSFGVLGDDRSLQQQARRLSSLVQLASDEALMQGRDFGIEFTRTGYRFLEHDPLTNRWYELLGDDLLRPRELEEPLELALVLEDREVELTDRFAVIEEEDDDDDEADRSASTPADDYAPHVLILSSGDVTPFDLHIIRFSDRSEVVVGMAPNGEMEIQTAGASS